MPEDKKEKPASPPDSPEVVRKKLKKKLDKANDAARNDIGWGIYHTLLLGAIGVGLFFLFPFIPLLAFVAVALVTGYVSYSMGIISDPFRNLNNAMKHGKEGEKAQKEISKIDQEAAKAAQKAAEEKVKPATPPAPVPAPVVAAQVQPIAPRATPALDAIHALAARQAAQQPPQGVQLNPAAEPGAGGHVDRVAAGRAVAPAEAGV